LTEIHERFLIFSMASGSESEKFTLDLTPEVERLHAPRSLPGGLASQGDRLELDTVEDVLVSMRNKLEAKLDDLGIAKDVAGRRVFKESKLAENVAYAISEGVVFPREQATALATITLQHACYEQFFPFDIHTDSPDEQLHLAAILFRASGQGDMVKLCAELAAHNLLVETLQEMPIPEETRRQYAMRLVQMFLHSYLPDEMRSVKLKREMQAPPEDEAAASAEGEWERDEDEEEGGWDEAEADIEYRIADAVEDLLRSVDMANVPLDRATLRTLGQIYAETYGDPDIADTLEAVISNDVIFEGIIIDPNEEANDAVHRRFREQCNDIAGFHRWMEYMDAEEDRLAKLEARRIRPPRRRRKKKR
jgi:hypothetical protein